MVERRLVNIFAAVQTCLSTELMCVLEVCVIEIEYC